MISSARIKIDYKQEFLDACDYAFSLRERRGNITNIIKAYEKARDIYTKIVDVDPDNKLDNELIEEYNGVLTDLREDYYTLFAYQHRKNLLDEAKLTNAKIRDCCIALGQDTDAETAIDDLRARLIETASKWNLDYHHIPQDGNCLFHAIAHQLEINKISINKNRLEKMHVALRRLAAEHLLRNKDYYQPSLSDGETIAHYVKQIGHNKEWADHFEITALVRELTITLVIIQHDAQLHIFKTRNNHPILFIGYEKGMHFASLLKRPESNIADYILQTLRKAEFIEYPSGNNSDQIIPVSHISDLEMTRIGNIPTETKIESMKTANTPIAKSKPQSSIGRFFCFMKTKITTQDEEVSFTPETLGAKIKF